MGFIVVDNSALLPLFLSDEPDDYSRLVLFELTAGEELIAPSLCLLEFGNGILKAVRRKRLTEAQANFAHRTFASLPIEFRDLGNGDVIPRVHAIAQRHHLSFYDAAYLSLALDCGARLASLDEMLRGAALAEGAILI